MDPKKHGFWMAMGGAALVAALLYYILVVAGVNAEARAKEAKLKQAVRDLEKYATIAEEKVGDPKEGLPIPETVAYWEQWKSHIEGEKVALLKLFEELDKKLEKVDTEEPASFVANARKLFTNLTKRYKGILPEGKAFEEVVPVFGQTPPQTAKEIPFAQKKILIGEAVADALLAAGATLVEVVEFDPEPGELKDEQKTQLAVRRLTLTVGARMPAPGARSKEADKDRKDALARFKLDRETPPGLNALLSALLKHPDLVFEVREMQTVAAPFSYPALRPWRVFPERQGGLAQEPLSFDQDVYVATQDTQSQDARDEPPPILEPSVRVTLKLAVMDFHIPPAEEK